MPEQKTEQVVVTNNSNVNKLNGSLIYTPQNLIKSSKLLKKTNFLSEQFQSISTDDDDEKLASKIGTNLKKVLGEPHPFNYKVIDKISEKVAIISSITDKISDFTLGNGYIITSDDEKIVDVLNEWRKQTHFDFFLKPHYQPQSKGKYAQDEQNLQALN